MGNEGIPKHFDQIHKVQQGEPSEADTVVKEEQTSESPVSRFSITKIQRKLLEKENELGENTLVRDISFSENAQVIPFTRKFENSKRITEELGEPILFEEVLQHIPKDFDTSVFSERTREYLKNAYPDTEYWDPRLITALDECGIHMDLERTIKPRILVTLKVNHEKRYVTLNIKEAVTVLLAYVHAGENKEKQYKSYTQ